MASSSKSDQQVLATTLIGVVQDTIRNMCNLEFSQDAQSLQRDIIEYDSRMRTFGLEKFNGPCYATSVSFYRSEKQKADHDACGAMNLYLDEEAAPKILKALGHKGFNDEDEEMVLDKCAEFCNILAGNLKAELGKSGYGELYLSAPVKQKNDIAQGIEFPYSQYKYFETQYFLWKKKAIVADIVMAPV